MGSPFCSSVLAELGCCGLPVQDVREGDRPAVVGRTASTLGDQEEAEGSVIACAGRARPRAQASLSAR
jgi:hypothetical protein